MGSNESALSDAALRALNEILLYEEFDQDAPAELLDNVLAYLRQFTGMALDEARLEYELQEMPVAARESLCRAIAAVRRR
jgi:hypothetical protein